MPMRDVPFRDPVPDLPRIDRSRWREVLGALADQPRIDAASIPGVSVEAIPLALELPKAPSELAREALARGPSLSLPDVRRAGAARQVNVRLRAEEHESLHVAAKLLGLTPTQVARMCILTGGPPGDRRPRRGARAPQALRNEPAASSDGPATAPAARSAAISSAE